MDTSDFLSYIGGSYYVEVAARNTQRLGVSFQFSSPSGNATDLNAVIRFAVRSTDGNYGSFTHFMVRDPNVYRCVELKAPIKAIQLSKVEIPLFTADTPMTIGDFQAELEKNPIIVEMLGSWIREQALAEGFEVMPELVTRLMTYFFPKKPPSPAMALVLEFPTMEIVSASKNMERVNVAVEMLKQITLE